MLHIMAFIFKPTICKGRYVIGKIWRLGQVMLWTRDYLTNTLQSLVTFKLILANLYGPLIILGTNLTLSAITWQWGRVCFTCKCTHNAHAIPHMGLSSHQQHPTWFYDCLTILATTYPITWKIAKIWLEWMRNIHAKAGAGSSIHQQHATWPLHQLSWPSDNSGCKTP